MKEQKMKKMGGGHHVDWSDTQQSQGMADDKEVIQRPNLYKPSVSGQCTPIRTSACSSVAEEQSQSALYYQL